MARDEQSLNIISLSKTAGAMIDSNNIVPQYVIPECIPREIYAIIEQEMIFYPRVSGFRKKVVSAPICSKELHILLVHIRISLTCKFERERFLARFDCNALRPIFACAYIGLMGESLAVDERKAQFVKTLADNRRQLHQFVRLYYMNERYASVIADIVTADIDLILDATINSPGWNLSRAIYLSLTDSASSLRVSHIAQKQPLLSILDDATVENKIQFSMAAIGAGGITNKVFIKRGFEKSGGKIYLYTDVGEIKRPIYVKTEEGDTIDLQRLTCVGPEGVIDKPGRLYTVANFTCRYTFDEYERYRLGTRLWTIENYMAALRLCEHNHTTAEKMRQLCRLQIEAEMEHKRLLQTQGAIRRQFMPIEPETRREHTLEENAQKKIDESTKICGDNNEKLLELIRKIRACPLLGPFWRKAQLYNTDLERYRKDDTVLKNQLLDLIFQLFSRKHSDATSKWYLISDHFARKSTIELILFVAENYTISAKKDD